MSDKLNSKIIKNENDVFIMLDTLLEKKNTEWWNKFYSDREKPVPFFKNRRYTGFARETQGPIK